MARLPKDMQSSMADIGESLPKLNVRNTFLEFEVPESTQPCRSQSCPPVLRLDRPNLASEEAGAPPVSKAKCLLRDSQAHRQAVAALSAGVRRAAPAVAARAPAAPVSPAAAAPVVAAAPAVAAAPVVATPDMAAPLAASPVAAMPVAAAPVAAAAVATVAAARPRPTAGTLPRPQLDKDKFAAIFRGPPPYAPPVCRSARQEKRVASGPASPPELVHEAAGPCVTSPAKSTDVHTLATVPASACAKNAVDITGVTTPEKSPESAEDVAAPIIPRKDGNTSTETAADDGDWAVVEVKRKKKPQVRTSEGDSAGNVQVVAAARAQQTVHHQLEIGIEDDPEFQVIKRLIGPGGLKMDRIRGGCLGTKVELRGVGTKSLVDDSGPLVLHIKGDDASQCANALARATELVSNVKKEYESFVAKSLPCEVVDSQEDSTSADDSAHVHNDDSDDASWEQRSPRGRAHMPHLRSKLVKPECRPAVPASAAIHHELPIGLSTSSQFPIVKKLIGLGGENIRNISNSCPGTKLELRGEGTNPWSGGESGPLVLHVRGHDHVQCAAALKLANELIDGVRKDHERFLDLQACR